MGYRRDGKRLLHDDIEWKEWRKANDDLVTASGLPELVVSDADHWYDFVDHGHLDHHEDPLQFSVSHLTVRQKAFLLQLVSLDGTLNSILGGRLLSDLIAAVKDRYRE